MDNTESVALVNDDLLYDDDPRFRADVSMHGIKATQVILYIYAEFRKNF